MILKNMRVGTFYGFSTILPNIWLFSMILMRGADFFQRESVVDDGFEASGENVAEHFVEFAHRAHVRPEQ